MATRDLDRWGASYARRDEVIRTAAASGVGVNEIARRMGIAKTTVIRSMRAASSATSTPRRASSTPYNVLADVRHLERTGIYAEPVVDEPAAAELVAELPEWPERIAERWDEPEPVDERGRLVVVGCGADKLDHPAAAERLYTGSYFRSCLSTALAIADRADIRILSAKHGLVRLDDVLEPYDVTLGDPFDCVDAGQVRAQAHRGGIAGRRVLALAPARYAELLERAGFTVDAPLAGLPIGKQRHVLAELRG